MIKVLEQAKVKVEKNLEQSEGPESHYDLQDEFDLENYMNKFR